MRTQVFGTILAIALVLFTGCQQHKHDATLPTTTIEIPKVVVKEVSKSKSIPVGEENFQRLNDYVWKHGFSIGHGTRQHTFFDSKGNRHALLATRTGAEPAEYIVVYGYYHGIKNQKHFFGYEISKERLLPALSEKYFPWKDAEAATVGYKELLQKAKAEK